MPVIRIEWETRQRNQAGILHWCPSWWPLGTTCKTCAIRLNDLPYLFYQQVGSFEYGPEATSGLGSYSQYALEALNTGHDLGSITCFSFHSIRSNISQTQPAAAAGVEDGLQIWQSSGTLAWQSFSGLYTNSTAWSFWAKPACIYSRRH